MPNLSPVENELDPTRFVHFDDSPFQLYQPYVPAGDQPAAIEQLVAGVQDGLSFQTLLGVTGSGNLHHGECYCASGTTSDCVRSEQNTGSATVFRVS